MQTYRQQHSTRAIHRGPCYLRDSLSLSLSLSLSPSLSLSLSLSRVSLQRQQTPAHHTPPSNSFFFLFISTVVLVCPPHRTRREMQETRGGNFKARVQTGGKQRTRASHGFRRGLVAEILRVRRFIPRVSVATLVRVLACQKISKTWKTGSTRTKETRNYEQSNDQLLLLLRENNFRPTTLVSSKLRKSLLVSFHPSRSFKTSFAKLNCARLLVVQLSHVFPIEQLSSSFFLTQTVLKCSKKTESNRQNARLDGHTLNLEREDDWQKRPRLKESVCFAIMKEDLILKDTFYSVFQGRLIYPSCVLSSRSHANTAYTGVCCCIRAAFKLDKWPHVLRSRISKRRYIEITRVTCHRATADTSLTRNLQNLV